jgi:hypothetical protein
MRRRLLTAAIALGLVAGGVRSAEAKPPARTERTIHGSYAAYPAPATGCNDPLGSWACMIVRARPTERFVSVKVTDTHGLPVYFSVYNPGTGFFADFCGETETPLLVDRIRYMEIEVGVSRWAVQTHCPASSVKTTGTIKVTLSDQRKSA